MPKEVLAEPTSIRPYSGRVARRPWLWILVAGAGWGSGTVASRAAVQSGIPVFAVFPARFVLATLALIAALRLTGRRLILRPAFGKGAALGVVNMALPSVFLTLAVFDLAASTTGLLVALVPLATVAAAHLLVPGEPLRLRIVPGFLMALAGVAVLVGGAAESSQHPLRGVIWTMAGVAAAGVGGALSRRFATEESTHRLVLPQFVVATAVMLAAAAVWDGYQPAASFNRGQWGLLIFLAFASTTIPFVAFLRVTELAPASFAGLVGYLVPLVSAAGGVAFLSERITTGLVMGGALIIGGVLLAEWADRSSVAAPYSEEG